MPEPVPYETLVQLEIVSQRFAEAAQRLSSLSLDIGRKIEELAGPFPTEFAEDEFFNELTAAVSRRMAADA